MPNGNSPLKRVYVQSSEGFNLISAKQTSFIFLVRYVELFTVDDSNLHCWKLETLSVCYYVYFQFSYCEETDGLFFFNCSFLYQTNLCSSDTLLPVEVVKADTNLLCFCGNNKFDIRNFPIGDLLYPGDSYAAVEDLVQLTLVQQLRVTGPDWFQFYSHLLKKEKSRRTSQRARFAQEEGGNPRVKLALRNTSQGAVAVEFRWPNLLFYVATRRDSRGWKRKLETREPGRKNVYVRICLQLPMGLFIDSQKSVETSTFWLACRVCLLTSPLVMLIPR